LFYCLHALAARVNKGLQRKQCIVFIVFIVYKNKAGQLPGSAFLIKN